VRSSEKERGRQGKRKQGETDKRHSGNTEAIIGRGQEEQMTDQTRDHPVMLFPLSRNRREAPDTSGLY